MKKLSPELYLYKGIEVHKLSSGNYFAKVPVNDYKLPIEVIGATQASFKKIFNKVVKENGGLKEAK
jgi:hypothetical protein